MIPREFQTTEAQEIGVNIMKIISFDPLDLEITWEDFTPSAYWKYIKEANGREIHFDFKGSPGEIIKQMAEAGIHPHIVYEIGIAFKNHYYPPDKPVVTYK